LLAYNAVAKKRRDVVEQMTADGANNVDLGKALGLTRGAAYRLRLDIANGRSTTAGHGFPQFKDWIAERWDESRGLLRLKVVGLTRRPEPQAVWNMLVGSHDHSYLLANGANNFNSFETMSGKVYYPFDRTVHVGKYQFNPLLPIWIGQDFNIDPMSTVLLQPQPSGEIWCVDELMLKSASTEDVAREIEKKYFKFQRNMILYPDPAGAYRQHARGESDLDIFRDAGFTRQKFRRKHPPVADRINAVNRMLRTASGQVRLRFDEHCTNIIESLEQTTYKPGGREVDKGPGWEHFGDALGYPIEFEFPVRKFEILGVSI
jgi:hypothetical protein